MPYDPDRVPDLGGSFPRIDDNLKINKDLNNPVHGPHYDIINGIPGGINKLRIDPLGNPIDSSTQIGPLDMPWNPNE